VDGNMPRDETFNQMLNALKSAQRYVRAQKNCPSDLVAEIDAAIRRADSEQRGHLTAED
jgi:hypothetical protein